MARKKAWHTGIVQCESRTSRESKVTAIFGLLSMEKRTRMFQTYLPDSSSVAVSCSTLAKCQTQCHFLHRTPLAGRTSPQLGQLLPITVTPLFPPPKSHHREFCHPQPLVLKFEPPKTCIIFFPKKNNHPACCHQQSWPIIPGFIAGLQ